ncbi:MAG: hypothetical protein AAGH64_07900 [Planctomycetota bacterium]
MSGSSLVNDAGSVTVGPGPEFTIVGDDGTFEVDISGTSVRITASTSEIFTLWGSNGFFNEGGLELSGLDFGPDLGIVDIATSGTATFADSNITFTNDSVLIGGPNPPLITWVNNSTIIVDFLVDDGCPGPNVVLERTGTEFPTIAAAAAASQEGDVLLLSPCTYAERGIDISGLTLRGSGTDQTIIDGGGETGTLLLLQGSPGTNTAATLQDLTLTSARSVTTAPAGLLVERADISIRRCAFRQLEGGAISFIEDVTARIDDSVFDSNSAGTIADAVSHLRASRGSGAPVDLTIVNTLFSRSDIPFGNQSQADITLDTGVAARFVNCTFAQSASDEFIEGSSGALSVELTNCVLDDSSPRIVRFTVPVIKRSVFSGAQGDNTDAVPIFADPSAGDFTLAPGSPGIDYADANAYIDAGGGITDLARASRTNDDRGTPNTGTGLVSFLDAGAFEFQGRSLEPADGDLNGDGLIDFFDLGVLLNLIAADGD